MPKFYVSAGPKFRDVVEARDQLEAFEKAVQRACESRPGFYIEEVFFVSERGFVELDETTRAYASQTRATEMNLQARFPIIFDDE